MNCPIGIMGATINMGSPTWLVAHDSSSRVGDSCDNVIALPSRSPLVITHLSIGLADFDPYFLMESCVKLQYRVVCVVLPCACVCVHE